MDYSKVQMSNSSIPSQHPPQKSTMHYDVLTYWYTNRPGPPTTGRPWCPWGNNKVLSRHALFYAPCLKKKMSHVLTSIPGQFCKVKRILLKIEAIKLDETKTVNLAFDIQTFKSLYIAPTLCFKTSYYFEKGRSKRQRPPSPKRGPPRFRLSR